MRSPQIIGEECPRPGICACQRIFSFRSTFQAIGAAELVSSPLACTPRNCGQLAAEISAARNNKAKSRVGFIKGSATVSRIGKQLYGAFQEVSPNGQGAACI